MIRRDELRGTWAIRQISLLGTGYNPSLGVDLVEALTMVDVGDVNVIPANIEKSFDLVAKAVSYVYERAGFCRAKYSGCSIW